MLCYLDMYVNWLKRMTTKHNRNLIEIEYDQEMNCRWISLYPSGYDVTTRRYISESIVVRRKDMNSMSRKGILVAIASGHICDLEEDLQ